jgi:hypothetical protein
VAEVDAIVSLTEAFADASVGLGSRALDDRRSVVISWPAVPTELVRAAGLSPMVVRGDAAATPAADAHLEGAAFPSRIRQLVEAVLAGGPDQAACLVLPRTSSADYHGFLYLRELVRRAIVRRSGPILLFDLLQTTGSDVAAHNAARTRALFAILGAVGGSASIDRLVEEIAHANAARAAVRRVVALRGGTPRISGADALPLIGAFWQLAPEVYAPLAMAAADVIATRPPLDGPRVLLLGAPVDGPQLHAAIESHGAIVVAETGPWGIGAAGDDVTPGADPFVALADKYRRDAWGPRTSVVDARRWTAQALNDVDAVVVSLPPDDAVFGWDYPWLRERLEVLGLPHVCLTHDPCQPVLDADHERLAAVVSGATSRLAVRRG